MPKLLNILLIEDHPSDVLLLEETLKDSGVAHKLTVVEDGEAAVEYVRQMAASWPRKRPDLVFLDLNLPRRDGHEVLAELRKFSVLNELTVVVLTTSENPEDRKKVAAQNACYIVKPLKIENLFPVLAAIEIAYCDIVERKRAEDSKQASQLLEKKDTVRVLLVEDNPHDSLLVDVTLKSSNLLDYELVTEEDLESALRVLKEQKFDVILADLGLPDAHGLEVLSRLQVVSNESSIVVLTGLDDETLAVEAVARGAQDYLVKGQLGGGSLLRSIRYAITRKRAEEIALNTIASENSVLQEILENAPIGMARFSSDLTISNCNSVFSTLLQVEPKVIIGKKIAELVPIGDVGLWQQSLDTGVPFRDPHATVWTDPQASATVCDLTVWPIKSRDSDTKGGIILVLDISERVKLERQKEDFIAALAHDIKNPLVGADRVLTHLTNTQFSIEQTVSMMALVRQSNSNVIKMLQDLLDIYRYDNSAEKVLLQPIDILDPIMAAVSMTSLLAIERKISIKLDFPNKLPRIKVDKFGMQRLFTNLLHNSMKFSHPGSDVHVSAHQDGESLVVEIIDFGRGMSRDEQESLFKRFGDSRAMNYRGSAGTGLGLYLCKQIVHANHGFISCQSAEDQGTRFTIRFPVWVENLQAEKVEV